MFLMQSSFPSEYTVAIAILSGYAGLIVIVKIKNAITRKPIEQ